MSREREKLVNAIVEAIDDAMMDGFGAIYILDELNTMKTAVGRVLSARHRPADHMREALEAKLRTAVEGLDNLLTGMGLTLVKSKNPGVVKVVEQIGGQLEEIRQTLAKIEEVGE